MDCLSHRQSPCKAPPQLTPNKDLVTEYKKIVERVDGENRALKEKQEILTVENRKL